MKPTIGSARLTTGLVASVRQRLLNLSKKQGEDFNLTLTRYAIERFLYRLAASDYAERFVLKGASLFFAWTGQLHRPTRDIDLLGYGESSPEEIGLMLSEICMLDVEPDGIYFDAGSIQLREIKEAQEYPGIRVILKGYLGSARIRTQVDIGFGDAVMPAVQRVKYPGLLDLPTPELVAYPKEAVIAEKCETMISRGALNSRMKDFYDIWTMSHQFSFDGVLLAAALKTTFTRRKTPFPADDPISLTIEYGSSLDARKQWRAFISRGGLSDRNIDFADVIARLREFLLPPLQAIKNDVSFVHVWCVDEGWCI